ncbi:hypothetical protein FBU30_004959 [Linnemannia zychae]|nr:hypothetical protein FBU30_004959 [Linnemannia zychae]
MSSRFTPEEEEELRSASGSTDQIQESPSIENPSSDLLTIKPRSVTSSPVVGAVTTTAFSLRSPATSESTKKALLTPVTLNDKRQQQTCEKQHDRNGSGRWSIDVESKEAVQEEIQATAYIDEDMDILPHGASPKRTSVVPQQQHHQKQQSLTSHPIQPTEKILLDDKKLRLTKPTSLSIPSSEITPTILISTSSPSSTVRSPLNPSGQGTSTATTGNNNNSSTDARPGNSSSVVALEPSKPARDLIKDRMATPHEIQLSSGSSVRSTSPTLVSATSSVNNGGTLQQRRTSSMGSHTSLTTTITTTSSSMQQHVSSSSLTLEAAGPPSTLEIAYMDPQHFATQQRLQQPFPTQLQQPSNTARSEHTLQSSSSIKGMPPSPLPSSHTPASTTPLGTPPSNYGYQMSIEPTSGIVPMLPEDESWRKRMKGKARAVNLEEDRQCIARSFTELVLDSWSRIYRTLPEQHRTPQTRQDRMKTAMQLKDAIVTFWSVQSYFQERAELILDVQQDPLVLENRSRFRILKSEHLNNLLSQEPMHSHEINYILEKYQQQHDLLTTLSEQLQNVWLGILLLLGDPNNTQPSTTTRWSHHKRLHMDSMHHLHSAAGSSSSGYSMDYRNPSGIIRCDGGREAGGRGGPLRLSRNKRLGFKVAVMLILGAALIIMALILNSR